VEQSWRDHAAELLRYATPDGVRGFAVLHPFGEPGTIAVTDAAGASVFTYDIGE
jgi:hypothetical protein